MTAIDQLLLKLVDCTTPTVEEVVPSRDSKVLRSLATTVRSPLFVTENQSRLLLKIFNEHQASIQSVIGDITLDLGNPSWSKDFRQVDKTKKLHIVTNEHNVSMLAIEFAFSSAIRKLMGTLSKKVSGLVQHIPGKFYFAELTEKNIEVLIAELSKLDFEIDERLKNYHEIIKSWDETTTRGQFVITNITHSNFQKHITADLGINTAIDQNIISDRSIRYQYFCEKTGKTPETLTEKIANRTAAKYWVNKNDVSLSEVFQTIIDLKRLPTLVVFDSFDPNKCVEDLTKLSDSLENSRIFDNVGIYFRLDNTETGKQFNQFIADKQYNCQLSSDTKIVGVQSGKLPKFLLKSDWKPMSVISIRNPLRHSKTAVYANNCDLVISYTESEPIVESRILWE